MRIALPHAGQRRRSGRNTRSRSGVRAWHLAIAPSSSTASPNHQAYRTASFAAVDFFGSEEIQVARINAATALALVMFLDGNAEALALCTHARSTVRRTAELCHEA